MEPEAPAPRFPIYLTLAQLNLLSKGAPQDIADIASKKLSQLNSERYRAMRLIAAFEDFDSAE